ncbi:hypothetical protein [Hoylesella enoeca]|uniref:Uncharacterized protein n=1 Tax=Hoylesella enoeca TaxID=76123 RepID=A0A0S2KJI3_9BACT|nr:hypothetical protein [Hoylesella enoeca]ALO48275.1 hypothetical protein AS203_03585 [Hoylesella enoeca]
MKTNNNLKIRTNTANHRSFFDWGCNMQVIRKENGEIAMTESQLARFFGVTWRKVNHRFQTIMTSSDLHPDERDAGQGPVFINGQTKGYAPLYPLSIIISLSFLLDGMEAHLFRKYICERLQKPASVITPIFLLGSTNN